MLVLCCRSEKDSIFMRDAEANFRYWRRWAILNFMVSAVLALISFYLGGALIRTKVLARQDLMTHTNLYYQMWKSGDRPFEPSIAFSGLFHDREYQDSLIGLHQIE